MVASSMQNSKTISSAFALLLLTSVPVFASDNLPEDSESSDDQASWASFVQAAKSEEQQKGLFEAKLYGYIDIRAEQVADTPTGVENGKTIYESNPYEFDIPNFHIMIQGSIASQYKYFINLAGPGAGSLIEDDSLLVVRNAWVQAPIPTFGEKLQIRLGKTYRRFGLYNEILDASPTFIGIEPPELFDGDHLMLTRTTHIMLHGHLNFGSTVLAYSASTGNDERINDAVPLGFDLNLSSGFFKIGSSFYWTGGDAGPSKEVGDGSPDGGVLPWMAKDEYYVFGGYAELSLPNLIIQLAYWQADHSATRDPVQVAKLAEAALNPRQLRRFFINGDPAQGLQDLNVDFSIQTAYGRLGLPFTVGEQTTLIPYAQVDYYRNPETVQSKTFGGDNEAGLADDGAFWKVTTGLVIRPVYPIALKIDGSAHIQEFNNETIIYPEIRLSLSYYWEVPL